MSFNIDFIRRISLAFFFILLFSQTNSSLNFNYDIITYTKDASKNITLSPEFYNLKKFHQTIEKKITLENGNQVLCHIPAFVEDINETKIEIEEKRLLSQEEGEAFLNPLKDVCATYPTRFFLYEFCYKKYAKQFDDTNTIFWGNKQSAETYYLGKDPHYNITTGLSFAPSNENPVIYFHSIYPFALVRGRAIKTYGYMYHEKFLFNSFLKITFSLPLIEILKYPNLIITVDGYTYLQVVKITPTLKNNLVNVERVIHCSAYDNHFILEEEFPFDFVTDQFKISKLPKEFEKSRKSPQLNLKKSVPNFFFYKNYLYISMINGQFITTFEPFDFILISLEKTKRKKLLQVKSIISDNLIELTSNSETLESDTAAIYHSYSFSGENQTFVWEIGNGDISIYETMIFGKNTTFLNIDKHDVIGVIHENKRVEFFVKEVLTNEIMIIDAHPLINFEYDGDFVIGKEIEEKNGPKNDGNTSKTFKNFTTNALMKSLDIPLSLYFPTNPKIKKKLLCPESFKLIHENRGLIIFDLRKLIRKNEFSLTLILSESNCKENGIYISFLTTEKIIINNYQEKENYVSSGISFENMTISNQTIWILIDEGVLHLGISKKIGYKTQLLEFPIKTQKLNYIQFIPEESFNIQLNNFFVSDFDPQLEQFLKYFSYHPRKSIQDDELKYYEYYDKGTECILPNKKLSRKLVVEYICSKTGSLLEIEDIDEPDTCEYHLKIGTYLLCPSSWNFGKITKNFNKIFCHLES